MSKAKKRSESMPSQETGYTEQENSDKPKILDRCCGNCINFTNNGIKKIVSYESHNGNAGKYTQSREFETDKPFCNKHEKIVDDLFGTCDFFEKSVI